MLRFLIFSIFIQFGVLTSNAQNLDFYPKVILGNRSTQFQYAKSNFILSYAIGSTYQNGFTIEQALHLNFSPSFNKKNLVYVNLFLIVNTHLKILNRGIQQMRFGIKTQKLITGIATNLDRCTKVKQSLENYGLFIKYNF